MPCCAASSRTVSTRIEPVKCRCRWALGRSVTDRCGAAAGAVTRRRGPCPADRLLDDVDGGLLGGGTGAVDADVGADELLVDVVARALVRRHEPARPRVADLGVPEPVVLCRDAVGVVAADTLPLAGPGHVVGGAVGGVGVGELLLDALVDRLVAPLLLGGHAVHARPAVGVGRGEAGVEDVVELVVDEGVDGLQLVLVVDAVVAQVVADVLRLF